MIHIIPSQENDPLAVELSALLGVSVLPFDDPIDLVFNEGTLAINLAGEDNPYAEEIEQTNTFDILDLAQIVHMRNLPQTTHSIAQVARQVLGEFWR